MADRRFRCFDRLIEPHAAAAFSIALSVELAALFGAPPAPLPGDPGPHPSCPVDTRLVEGTHFANVAHLCTNPKVDTKDTHCFAYHPFLTVAEGPETPVRVCMDQFEAPNKRGARPLVMQSYKQAQKYCSARKKRVCTEMEWELACEGGTFQPLAYGWAVDTKKCNSGKPWMPVEFGKFALGGEIAKAESDKLWQGATSGAYPACASGYGVYDMNGNVEEWVTSRAGRKWPGALMGGFWSKPWTGCRGTNDAHEPGFQFYETGFRCCAEPASTFDEAPGAAKPDSATPTGVSTAKGKASATTEPRNLARPGAPASLPKE